MIKIRTLKYNYRATGIVDALQSQGFTIYRDSIANKFESKNLINWRVGVPSKYKGQIEKTGFNQQSYTVPGQKELFKILTNAAQEIANNSDSLTENSIEEFLWGYAPILEIRYKDSSMYIYQQC